MEIETAQTEKQHYQSVPVSPEARFALMQLGINLDLRQMHQVPVSPEAQNAARAHLLALHTEAFTPNGHDVVIDAVDLLRRGIITDGGFVTLFQRRHGQIFIPPGHEVFDIYDAHLGEILKART